MKYSVEWHEDAVNAAPEERATVADLRLFVGRLNVTQHLLEGKVNDHVLVALYGLAHGLAHDWWTIFGSRDRLFSLTRYRSGYLLPDLRFGFDGAAFEVEARQSVYEERDLRFWAGPSEVLDRGQGEAWLSGMIEEILGRLKSKGLGDTSAALRWKRVLASRNSDEGPFCEAAGSLGLDPYQIDDSVTAFIERAESVFGREALVEFVSGAAAVDRERLMRWVERMAKDKSFRYRLADLEPAVADLIRATPGRPGDQPYDVGYRRAAALRKQIGIKPEARFTSMFELAKRLGAFKSFNVAPHIDGIRALRHDREDGVHVHVRNHGDSAEASAAQLFALARSVGDVACFPGPQLAPINDLHSAYRQAAGRAFAAEFLAPSDEIESMREAKHDLVTIANAFSVSQQVISHQIENRKRIVAAMA